MQTQGGAEVSRPKLAAVALAIVALDQLTKLAIVRSLNEGESYSLVGDVLRLTHIRNSGAAFGLLRGFSGLLALAALVGVIAFATVIVQRPPPVIALAAALVAGGALGNLIDRLFRGPVGRGSVVDFVHLSFWPAFNVADTAISIGAVMLVFASAFERPKTRPGTKPAA